MSLAEGESRRAAWISRVILLVALALYLLVSIGYFLGAGTDDDFISIWTGRTLAEGLGLTNHNRQRIEIGSSLLHTFILAVFYRLAPEHIYTLNKLGGLLAGAATLLLIARKRPVLFRQPAPWNLIALAGTIFSLTFFIYWLYWNLGGQETSYQALILCAYAILLLEYWEQPRLAWRLGLVQILYILVRAEGAFFVLPFSLLFGMLYQRAKGRAPNWLHLLGIPILFSLLLFAARFAWSGYWLPGPAMAKTGLDLPSRWNALKSGLKGLFEFYISPTSLVNLLLGVGAAGGVLGVVQRMLRRGWAGLRSLQAEFPRLFLPALILWNHILVLSIGAGIGSRFMIPAAPLLAIYGVGCLVDAARLILAPRVPQQIRCFFAPGMALLVGLLPTVFFFAVAHPANPVRAVAGIAAAIDPQRLDESLMRFNLAHNRDFTDILPFIENDLPALYQRGGNRLVIATGQMGLFPYTIKTLYPDLNIRFIDVAGLADPVVANLSEEKGTVGVLMGAQIEQIVTGQAGAFSEYVLAQEPNMIYALGVNAGAEQVLAQAGWELVWQRPEGLVFFREP